MSRQVTTTNESSFSCNAKKNCIFFFFDKKKKGARRRNRTKITFTFFSFLLVACVACCMLLVLHFTQYWKQKNRIILSTFNMLVQVSGGINNPFGYFDRVKVPSLLRDQHILPEFNTNTLAEPLKLKNPYF